MVSINVNTETTDDMVKVRSAMRCCLCAFPPDVFVRFLQGPVVSNRSESDLETAYPPSNKGHF